MMTTEQLTDCVAEIALNTGKSDKEIHEFVAKHDVKYSDVKHYSAAFSCLPDEKECAFIGKYGIDHLLNAKGISV